MSCLLGIDLGTSSVKVVVFGPEGALKGVGMSEYPILTPRLGYAEQDPEQWWRSTKAAVREALEKAGRPDILGTGFSGQMHGLVLLDKKKNLLRPALIWADQRSADVLSELKQTHRFFSSSAMWDGASNGVFDSIIVLAATIRARDT